jgi:hypothetical protein
MTVPDLASILDRVVEQRLVNVEEITFNPLNAFKTHPAAQLAAIKASFLELGDVRPILINATTGFLLDGEARVIVAKELGRTQLRADIVELPEHLEPLALALLHSLAAQSGTDAAKYDALLRQIDTNSAVLQQYLADRAEDVGLTLRAPFDADAEWQGMPPFEQNDLMPVRQIIVSFASVDAVAAFAQVLGVSLTDKTKSLWYPPQPHEDRRNLAYAGVEDEA